MDVERETRPNELKKAGFRHVEEIECAKIEYPKKGDSLYSRSDDWKLNACVSYVRSSKGMSWYAYTEGYREAAEAVCRFVDDTRQHQDLLVYPILFLWHHHVELRLKELIRVCKDLKDQRMDYGKNHHLNRLWGEVKQLVIEVLPEYSDNQEIPLVDSIIGELVELNRSAHALRYPENRQDELGFPEGIEHINIGNVNDVMCRCANHLNGLSTWLSVVKEDRDDERGYAVE
jgi:hypothetical protein